MAENISFEDMVKRSTFAKTDKGTIQWTFDGVTLEVPAKSKGKGLGEQTVGMAWDIGQHMLPPEISKWINDFLAAYKDGKVWAKAVFAALAKLHKNKGCNKPSYALTIVPKPGAPQRTTPTDPNGPQSPDDSVELKCLGKDKDGNEIWGIGVGYEDDRKGDVKLLEGNVGPEAEKTQEVQQDNEVPQLPWSGTPGSGGNGKVNVEEKTQTSTDQRTQNVNTPPLVVSEKQEKKKNQEKSSGANDDKINPTVSDKDTAPKDREKTEPATPENTVEGEKKTNSTNDSKVNQQLQNTPAEQARRQAEQNVSGKPTNIITRKNGKGITRKTRGEPSKAVYDALLKGVTVAKGSKVTVKTDRKGNTTIKVGPPKANSTVR